MAFSKNILKAYLTQTLPHVGCWLSCCHRHHVREPLQLYIYCPIEQHGKGLPAQNDPPARLFPVQDK